MKNSMDWFHTARFGMFIHWGPYAVLRRGEWVMAGQRMTVHEYDRVVEQFHAEHFDADAWARTASEAGMGYMVLTTKHHDGFCLWNTQTTDFNAVQHGPQRDLIAEYVAACRPRIACRLLLLVTRLASARLVRALRLVPTATPGGILCPIRRPCAVMSTCSMRRCGN